MIDIINDQIFHLSNEKVSYIFHLLQNKQLGHLYYGKTIKNLTNGDIQYFLNRDNKAAGTVKFYEDDNKFTLADTLQEYPVFGTSDYKDGGLSIFEDNTPLYLDFQYEKYEIINGKKRISGFPSSYADENESQTLIVFMKDKNYDITLEQRYTIFHDSPVIVRNQIITNNGDKKLTIERAMSTVLDLSSSDYDFVHLSGAWLKERHIKKHNLSQGVVSISSLRGASSHHQNPFVALEHKDATLTSGDAYGFNLIYSGNFLAQAEVDEWDNTRVMLGVNPEYFSWTLNNEESFMTPEAVMCFSSNGMNGLSIEFSHFIQKHIINRKWSLEPRPIVFNSWEASYFDYNDDTLLELAGMAKDLGMECFVIDDGWFAKRDHDKTSLGDWFVNEKKFPEGIKKFSDDINNLGLQLGVWFEPEMISPDSQLYKEHPDWAVHHECERFSVGRGQYVLDFSNPEVVDNIFNQMKKIILETNMKYIKWDLNRNITEAFSQYLKRKGINQTEFFHRYVLGFYDLYEKITSEFPDILIEGCAGGGGRYDLGVLYYSPQIWASDDSDAIERLKIQFGTATAYPISTLSNHISTVPNHQIDRITSLDTRYNVALFGSLGYELNLKHLTEDEREVIKNQIKHYKKYMKLILNGEFHKLASPFENGGNDVVWGVVNEDKSEALVGIYRILAEPNGKPYEYLKIPFLHEDKYYEIDGEYVLSGDTIKKLGLKKPYQFNGANGPMAKIKGDFQSWVFHIKEVENKVV